VKVALSAGHWPGARGACCDGLCEHEEAAYWCSKIAQYLPDTIEVYHVPTGPLKDKVADINAQYCDLAVEVHFNACGGCGASGTETLYCPGSVSGLEAARYVQAAMVTCGTRDRGTKEGWYKMDRANGADYFLRATNCTALILEPEFIEQHAKFDALRPVMTAAIARGICDYLGVDR